MGAHSGAASGFNDGVGPSKLRFFTLQFSAKHIVGSRHRFIEAPLNR
jgi:hypothetical protein